MLLRVLLEAVGTSARAVGPRFSSAGRLLRTVLLPTLERLGTLSLLSANKNRLLSRWVLHPAASYSKLLPGFWQLPPV